MSWMFESGKVKPGAGITSAYVYMGSIRWQGAFVLGKRVYPGFHRLMYLE